MVLSSDGANITASLDPGHPAAWRNEPYYSELKRWSALAAPSMGHVYVKIGKRLIVVHPHADSDLGIVEDDDRLLTSEIRLPGGGTRLEVTKVKHDDPRIAGQQVGHAFRPEKA